MLTCTSVYFPANNSQSHCSLWLNKSLQCINTTFSPFICLSGLLQTVQQCAWIWHSLVGADLEPFGFVVWLSYSALRFQVFRNLHPDFHHWYSSLTHLSKVNANFACPHPEQVFAACFLYVRHSDCGEMGSHCCLNTSLMAMDMEHFSYTHIYLCFFWKLSVRLTCPLTNWMTMVVCVRVWFCWRRMRVLVLWLWLLRQNTSTRKRIRKEFMFVHDSRLQSCIAGMSR